MHPRPGTGRADGSPLDSRAPRPRLLGSHTRVSRGERDQARTKLTLKARAHPAAAAHSYEFRQNEFVTSLKSVSLESKSTRSGLRDFIAVGTAVARAEDLTIKGGVSFPSVFLENGRTSSDAPHALQIYIFEVIPIIAHPDTLRLDHQIRLMYFEEAKAAVNNVCDLNGYLFLSMGQKLYARAFEQDEFLLAIGFLDVGVHVTTLTALKNFLLIGDEQQSISLVAFQVRALPSPASRTRADPTAQEDPYKLVLLGRDFRPSRVGGANFIVNEGKLAFVSNDDRGVLRLFEYDPTSELSAWSTDTKRWKADP